MKVYDAASIRNVAIVGHSGSGKTQLVSAILYDSGMVNRFGKVDEGTTITDYDEEEIARKHTLCGKPGVCRVEQEQDQSHRHAGRRQLPQRRPRRAAGGRCGRGGGRCRLWRDGPDRKGLGGGRRARPAAAGRDQPARPRSRQPRPDRSARCAKPATARSSRFNCRSARSGRSKAWSISSRGRPSSSRPTEAGSSPRARFPPDMAGAVGEAREALIEMVAEVDEKLMEKFFEAGTLTDDELVAGLRSATIAAKLFPLVCTSATLNIGVPQLLDAMLAYLPSPVERPFKGQDKSGGAVERAADEKKPAAAFVWKTIADPFAGRVTMFRVVSGSLKADSTVHNKTRDVPERLGHLELLQGKTQTRRTGNQGRRPRSGREAQGHAHQRHARRQVRVRSRFRRSSFPSRCCRTPSSPRAAATRTRSAPRCTGSRKRTPPSATAAIRRPRNSCCRARASCTSR